MVLVRISISAIFFANLAQLVEHLPRKEKVIGSIPIIGTQSIKEVRCKKAADFFAPKFGTK